MKCSIVGLGETATLWDGKGYSIGVNDCWKYGKTTDVLVVVNNFKKEPERYRIINDSRPREFYSNLTWWRHHPNFKELTMRRFTGHIREGTIYHSSTHLGTSPFIAISLAVNKGFKEIVLYGVDFTCHKVMKGNALDKEVKAYLKLIAELGKFGVRIYLYSNYGAFKDLLPVWK